MSLKIFLSALACLSVCGVAQAADDCFNEAAAYQGVNPWVLRALAWYESKGDASAIRQTSTVRSTWASCRSTRFTSAISRAKACRIAR